MLEYGLLRPEHQLPKRDHIGILPLGYTEDVLDAKEKA